MRTDKWLENKALERWKSFPRQRKVKRFIREYIAQFTEDNKDSSTVKLILGLPTAHCRHNKQYELLLDLTEDAMCRHTCLLSIHAVYRE